MSLDTASPSCAPLARQHKDALAGTAPLALGWLLVEVSGPWGRNALTESGLDPLVGAELVRRAADLDLKVVVVRAPGRHVRDDGARQLTLAHTGISPWMRRLQLDADADLLDIDPRVTLEAEPPEVGEVLVDPLLLVCTHAKRDACCARFGRPAAEALADEFPEQVLEVSHVGGHRFAANLVVLPDGVTYGGLDTEAVRAVASSHLEGTLDLAHVRGRGRLPRRAQAAELAARRELDLRDAREPVEVVALAAEGVTLRIGARLVEVELTHEPTGIPRPTSCDATEATDPGRFVVRGVRELHAS